MRASNKRNSSALSYRRVADEIIREIESNEREPGTQLPTMRELARISGISLGTAKHVYDVLEREGYILKSQGKGTFVREDPVQSAGAKPRAMAAIDRLLSEMSELGFSWQQTRIFLDLKLRQREQDEHGVRVGAVDCSPEALAMMSEQVATLPHTEVEAFLLGSVLESPRPFAPRADIVVTTTAHGEVLAGRMPGGQAPVCIVMSLETETAVELAALNAQARVGVLCKSERFAQVIIGGCDKYCKLKSAPQVAFFGDIENVRAVASSCDVLILAPNHSLFATSAERKIIRGSQARILPYSYKVERGSLVYLQNMIDTIYQSRLGI